MKKLTKKAAHGSKDLLRAINHKINRETINYNTGYDGSVSEFNEALPLRCSSGTYDTFEELEECLNIKTY